MDTQQQYFSALCQALEEKMGKRMHTSKDYEALAASIFEQTHQLVSGSTSDVTQRLNAFACGSCEERMSA